MTQRLSLASIEDSLRKQYITLYESIATKIHDQQKIFEPLPLPTQRAILDGLEKVIANFMEGSFIKTSVRAEDFDNYVLMVRELHTKMSDSDIAKRVGVSRPTILRLRRGILTKDQRPEILQSLERLYNANFPDGYKDDTVDDQCVVKEDN